MGMRRGYPNPLGTEMRFDFSSPLGMARVTGKYMEVGYGGKVKLAPTTPIAIPRWKRLNVSFF